MELDALVADLPPLTFRARLKELLIRGPEATPYHDDYTRLAPPVEIGEGPFVLGRSRFCDYRIHAATVSDRHAVLTRVNGNWVIEDLGSLNGTRVNGWLIRTAVLSRGDRLELGGVRFVFDAC